MSRKALVIGVQSALNIFLAIWLYNEYVHNRFMQDYLASIFSSMSFALPVELLAFAAIAGGSLTAYSRRHQITGGQIAPGLKTEAFAGSAEKLATLDTCPFCSIPLKNISENRFQCRKWFSEIFLSGMLQNISENRFQCRKCRRYIKK